MAGEYESAIIRDLVLVMLEGQTEAAGQAVAAISRVPELEFDLFGSMAQLDWPYGTDASSRGT